MESILNDRVALAALIDAGMTTGEIADRAGCSVATVQRVARRFGLPHSKSGRKPTPALADRDVLAGLIASGLSTAQIAERLGCSTNVVRTWTNRHGLALPRHSRRPPDPRLLSDVEWLREQHHDRGRSLTNIAREVGRAHGTVSRRFRVYGIPIRHQRTYPQLRDAGWLEEQFAAGKSSRTISREVGCSQAAVRLAAISLGVVPHGRSRTQRPSVDELRRVWAAVGVVRDLARRYHTADATIAGWLDESGIERNRRQR